MRPVHFAAARRTPIGKLRGALSSVRPDDLAAHVIRALVADVPARLAAGRRSAHFSPSGV